MTHSILLPLLGWAFLAFSAFWIFCVVYNVGVCSLNRGFLKGLLKYLDAAFLVFVFCAPLLFLDRQTVYAMLTFAPVTTWGHAILWATGALWLYALATQAFTSWRLYHPRNVPEVRDRANDHVPYPLDRVDWSEALPHPVPSHGETPPPLRRKKRPLKGPSMFARLAVLWPLNRINHACDLRVVRMKLVFPDLPEAFDGLRVLHLTDMHLGEDIPPGYFQHVIEHARAQNADLIVFTGDLTAEDNLYAESAALLAPLRAPLGVYMVRGNHDHNTEPEHLRWWLERCGVEVLENRGVDLFREKEAGERETLRLVGVEHPHVKVRDWGGVVRGHEGFTVALTHRPDFAPHLARSGARLILCGHTHGGQWRLPLIGPIMVPSWWGRRWARGAYRVGRAVLYVSSGFGIHTIPVRFRCPPEITLFELRRGD